LKKYIEIREKYNNDEEIAKRNIQKEIEDEQQLRARVRGKQKKAGKERQKEQAYIHICRDRPSYSNPDACHCIRAGAGSSCKYSIAGSIAAVSVGFIRGS
jgi:hypothetical protein